MEKENDKNKEKEKEEKKHYLGHFERLRKQFYVDDGQSLPDYVIVELILHEILQRRDVKPKAKALLQHFGSFVKLLTAPKETLKHNKVCPRLIFLLKLINCAAKRLSSKNLLEHEGHVLSNWDYVIDYCRINYGYEKIENCGLIFLNSKHEIVHFETIQKGTINRVVFYIREIIKNSLLNGAASLIICHNHPSGDTRPSVYDTEMTMQILNSLEKLDLELFDHVIISPSNHFSFRENNLLQVDALGVLLENQIKNKN